MNKKLLSIVISLIFHVMLLLAALFTVIRVTLPSSAQKMSLIHVRIFSQENSAKAYEGRKLDENNLVKKPEVKMAEPNVPQKKKEAPLQRLSATLPAKQEKPLVSDKDFVTVIDEKALQSAPQAAAVEHKSQARLMNASDVSKNLVISQGGLTGGVSALVSSDYKIPVNNSRNGGQGSPSPGSMLRNHQGHDPRVSFEHGTNSVDIKRFLGYELLTYEDPLDHNKYFKLKIRVGEVPGALPSIPKEIIFLLDASNSIGPDTLKDFKKGIHDCFNLLGVDDKFNLLVFRNTVVRMSNDSLTNTPVSIKKAEEFLGNIRVGLDTDIFDAVLKSMDLKNSMKPTYIFLVSDGQPTAGVKSPLQVINQIATINKGRVPVFALGSGIFLDRYFMSFLAFTNRGWAEFAPNSPEKGIVEMYNHIKNPVLLDLRYYLSGLDKKEIYPKVLPDLFKGSDFVLYGRYTTEKEFYFQLFGNTQTELKQYLINDDISQAPKGDRRIAQEWAIRKIYHLISLLEYKKNNQALIAEIEELAKKFKLKIPPIN